MPDDLEDVIEETAAGPARASADGRSTDAQRLLDLIEADKYLAAKGAAQRGQLGIRMTKIQAPPP